MTRIKAQSVGCRGEQPALEDVVIKVVGIGKYEGEDLKDLAGSRILDRNAPSN